MGWERNRDGEWLSELETPEQTRRIAHHKYRRRWGNDGMDTIEIVERERNGRMGTTNIL